MSNANKISLKVLYIVYWGAAEPLGQSLVLPAVKKLAQMGVKLTLVTFEKSADMARSAQLAEIRTALTQLGVEWIPLRYHRQPKVVWDVLQGVLRCLLIGLRVRPDIVHARTFVAGLVGLVLAPLLRAKLIFHNEGFFPDEQVDGGVWQENSLIHRTMKSLERKIYACSHGIIALSQRAKNVIANLPRVAARKPPIIVVPSCVDLQQFPPQPEAPPRTEQPLQLVYVGSVGRRHLMDKIGSFVATAAQAGGRVHLQVVSQTEKSVVNSMLTASGLAEGNWSYHSVPHTKIPAYLNHQHAGLLFYPRGLSEHGGSPTKVGEYWAAGLPVVTTPNVSDTDEIIRREKVGVVVEAHTAEAYRQALDELKQLLTDPELPQRCRQAAERYYALDTACQQQQELYRALVQGRSADLREVR